MPGRSALGLVPSFFFLRVTHAMWALIFVNPSLLAAVSSMYVVSTLMHYDWWRKGQVNVTKPNEHCTQKVVLGVHMHLLTCSISLKVLISLLLPPASL
jgi:hypothetical protein